MQFRRTFVREARAIEQKSVYARIHAAAREIISRGRSLREREKSKAWVVLEMLRIEQSWGMLAFAERTATYK